MIEEGRIQMNQAEVKAVDKLAGEHPGQSLSLTRRDPNETGPLLVHQGDTTYEIADDGKRKKVT